MAVTSLACLLLAVPVLTAESIPSHWSPLRQSRGAAWGRCSGTSDSSTQHISASRGEVTEQQNELWHNKPNNVLAHRADRSSDTEVSFVSNLGMQAWAKDYVIFFFFLIICTAISFTAKSTGEHLGMSRALAHQSLFPLSAQHREPLKPSSQALGLCP